MATDRLTLPAAFAPAIVLADRYRLERPLGVGGMASVWLARDTVLDRQVAAKVIADTLAREPSSLQRFEREARAIAALSHPNVVRVFDLGSDAGRPFIVMQYLPGGNLAERLAADAAAARAPAGEPPPEGAPPRRPARRRRTAAGRGHIHGAGLLHRDIKPSNILLGADGGVVLADFGVAWLPDATQLTATGDVLGTARYMAPELLSGTPASAASDLYACGRVIAAVERALGPDPGLVALADELTAAEPAAGRAQRRPRCGSWPSTTRRRSGSPARRAPGPAETGSDTTVARGSAARSGGSAGRDEAGTGSRRHRDRPPYGRASPRAAGHAGRRAAAPARPEPPGIRARSGAALFRVPPQRALGRASRGPRPPRASPDASCAAPPRSSREPP